MYLLTQRYDVYSEVGGMAVRDSNIVVAVLLVHGAAVRQLLLVAVARRRRLNRQDRLTKTASSEIKKYEFMIFMRTVILVFVYFKHNYFWLFCFNNLGMSKLPYRFKTWYDDSYYI